MSPNSLSPLTVEDLWSLPRVGTPAPSPDGRRYVVTVTRHDMTEGEVCNRLWLGEVEGSGAAQALTEESDSSRMPVWSPEGDRLLFLRKPGEDTGENAGREQLHIMDIDSREVEALTDMPLGVTDPRWLPDGRRVAFLAAVLHEAPTPEGSTRRLEELAESPLRVRVTENRLYRFWDHWLDEDRCHHVFVLDLDSGELKDLTPGSRRWFDLMDPTGQYDIDPDGLEIAFSACSSEPPHDPIRWGVYTVKLPARGSNEAVGPTIEIGASYAGGAQRPRYSPDGSLLLYGMRRESDFYADRVRLVARNRADGRDLVLTEHWDRSAASWCFQDESRVLLLAEESGRSALHAFDLREAVRAHQADPAELCRGGTFSGLACAGDSILVNHSSLSEAPEVARVSEAGLRRLSTFTSPILSQRTLGEVSEREFVGADGKPVQMFLVNPPGEVSRERNALLHLIHGGPHGNFGDQWHWRWNAQVFATGSGALCSCVNFHGSTGWGQDFAASILGSWGKQPYEDIMAATDLLVEEGLVDPARMAAAGGSYGGYLIAWLAAKTDRFACLVDHAGVNDLQAQYASDWTQGRRRAMGGEPWDDLEGLDRYNPMRHASGFETPLLVLHGEQDYRVPYSQGLAIYNVYKAMGLPARLVVYPDENHWILKPANSVHWYGEILTWLDRWLDSQGEETER